MPDRRRVLFLCSENSCRSQMAEGFLRSMATERFDVYSAGSKATRLNSNAVTVMAEAGVEISGQRSKSVDEFADQEFDYVITVCDDKGDGSCPVFSGHADQRLHWPFVDPAGATGSAEDVAGFFRQIRDQIRDRIYAFVERDCAEAAS